MKKFFSILAVTAAIAVVMTACNSNRGNAKEVIFVDTAGLAQFQAWKAMNQGMVPAQPNAAHTNTAVRNSSASHKSGSMNSSSTNNAKVAQKKGWSKAAKYSVIGGAGGAVLGAVINKRNRVAGGVIGGVLGGGIGYGLGRSKDKKEGRN